MHASDAGKGSREAWWSYHPRFYTRGPPAKPKLNSDFSRLGRTTPVSSDESKIGGRKSVASHPMRFLCSFLMAAMVAACSGCGSLGIGNSPGSKLVPQLGHVFLVVEENHSYSEVIGNAAMPYLNSLVSQGGLATQYFANAHPSIPN